MIPLMYGNKIILQSNRSLPHHLDPYCRKMAGVIMFNSISEECEMLMKSECLWNVWMVMSCLYLLDSAVIESLG